MVCLLLIKHFGGVARGQQPIAFAKENFIFDRYKVSNFVVPFWLKNSHKIIEIWSDFLVGVASDEAISIAWTFTAFIRILYGILYLKGYYKFF